MNTDLKDRVALVTGAGQGIGLATAFALRAEGAHVLAADLEVDRLSEAVTRDHGLAALQIDLAGSEGPANAVSETLRRFGAIDVLVNNLGVAHQRDGFLAVTDDEWLEVININLMSIVRACRAALPHMQLVRRGVIINLASDVARAPRPLFADYAVTKGAILTLSKVIANEFGPYGIRCNCVSPGPTRTPGFEATPMVDSVVREFGLSPEGALDYIAKNMRGMPLARIGQPEDVASAIVFLASDLACQVTGADYRVDGGLTPAP